MPPSSHNTSIAPISQKVNKNYAQNKKLFLCNFTSFCRINVSGDQCFANQNICKKIMGKIIEKGIDKNPFLWYNEMGCS